MNIEKFAKQIEPEDILTGEELKEYQEHMAHYLSRNSTKEQLIDKAKALYMSDRYKAKMIDILETKIRTLETELADLRQAGAPPVDDRAVCLQCGKVLEQQPGGRKKKYCSDACRMKYQRAH